jgi:hypothetical protein
LKPSILVILVVAGIVSTPGWAKEGGDQYPNGAENWYAGAAPPPGSYYVNYFGFYSGKLKNGSGANVWLDGTTPSVDATFNAFRFVGVTHLKLLGADYAAQVIVPVVDQSVDLGGTAGNTGIGDITVNPLILGWHHPQWHALTGIDVFLPTGYYDKNDARVSLGANYYGFDPLVAVSYMPRSGWEASAKLMYDLKTTNEATDCHSGQEFHTDYAAGKHVHNWMVGGTGYFVQQATDDTQAGQIAPAAAGMWDAGRRGRVLAVGPSMGYQNSRHMIFMADWQHETLVENRFGGDKFWFKMILPIDGLLRRGAAR